MYQLSHSWQRTHESGIQRIRKASFRLSLHAPHLLFRVGRPKYQVVIPNTANQLETYIGDEIASNKRGLYKLKYPLTHGVIENWDDMENLWRHAFNLLKISPN